MSEFLSHPATQGAIAPFIVALAIALLCQRMGEFAAGLVIIGGFFTTVILTTGVSFQPLSSGRKIVLASLCLPLLLPLIAILLRKVSVISEQWRSISMIVVPVVLLLIAINWIIWPVLSRQTISEAWPVLARVSLYVAVIGVVFLGTTRLQLPGKSPVQGMSVLALGLGTAVTSMIAASALYSQWAFSVVAAVGSLLLIGLVGKSQLAAKHGVGHLGTYGLFAAVVPLALIGAAATVYAQLSGWVLLCLAAIPLFAAWPKIKLERVWLRLLVTGLLALLPVIPAIWLAWRDADSMGY